MRLKAIRRCVCGLSVVAWSVLLPASSAAQGTAPLKRRYSFGPAVAGFTAVAPEMAFDERRGFGFEPGATLIARAVAVGGEQPFLFSVAVPEGNYRVTLTLVGAEGGSHVTVKAESRRLVLEDVPVAAGESLVRTIAVNVRNAQLPPPERTAPGGSAVVLNDREQGVLHWDDKLTLEINGVRPMLRALEIESDDTLPTVFLAGDSTVTDQPREPGASWGQMLPRFLSADVAVANHAESGETLKSFIAGLRLAKVLSQMKVGDYLFIQFGHNDSKQQWPQTWVEAHTTYRAYLKVFIAEARLRGATPVLVTSVQRRQFEPNGLVRNSHGDYPEAVREVAREERVALIDLEAMSRAFYEALGPDKAPRAFSGGGRDATHHNNYGAYELAKCVVQGIRDGRLDLARFVAADFAGFDPAHPDAVEAFRLAASPGHVMTAPPRGN